ncbi:MAG: ABC transporter ATP-binding protein [Planctomycetes bacterium]|nr:ABC transporter ATP-binding protein [Planctomycetota bacterium]
MIELNGITKTYRIGATEVQALAGVSLSIGPGEMVAVAGQSGSGKSTLMHILGCLDRPDSGSYVLEGRDVSKLGGGQLAEIRNRRIGFVFQSFNLLPRLTAIENVALPLLYRGRSDLPAAPGGRRCGPKALAEQTLDRVGLAPRMRHRPSQLSGGQNQRVAIARALITDPAIILADEPTGNLDTATGQEIMRLLADLNAEGRTILIVTHEPDIASQCRRQVHLRDGRMISC